MSVQIKRIAGGLGVQVNATKAGEPQTARTMEGALHAAFRNAGIKLPQTRDEVYDALDDLLAEPPTQILSDIACD